MPRSQRLNRAFGALCHSPRRIFDLEIATGFDNSEPPIFQGKNPSLDAALAQGNRTCSGVEIRQGLPCDPGIFANIQSARCAPVRSVGLVATCQPPNNFIQPDKGKTPCILL